METEALRGQTLLVEMGAERLQALKRYKSQENKGPKWRQILRGHRPLERSGPKWTQVLRQVDTHSYSTEGLIGCRP